LCVQETGWRNTGNRARFLDCKSKAYKLFYYGEENGRNGIGIILAAKLVSNVLSISKPSDRLMSIKLVMDGELWNIVSAYAPQNGCSDAEKDAFWQDFHNLLNTIPKVELLVVGGDLNGHVGQTNEDYEGCHGGHGYGTRNSAGEAILESCQSHGLVVLNTTFIKEDKHLVTYSSGGHETQIDYHLVASFMKRRVRDCNVLLGEPLALQHRPLMTIFYVGGRSSQKQPQPKVEKIKWYNLGKEEGEAYVSMMQEYLLDILNLVEDPNEGDFSAQDMWNFLQEPCLEEAKKLLGVSKGHRHMHKETWWWRKEAKEVVKDKEKAYKAWSKCPCSNREEKDRLLEEYKRCKKLAKRKCAQLVAAGAERLYEELEDISSSASDTGRAVQGLREQEPNKGAVIFKIAAQRRRNAQEISSPKFVSDSQGQLLVDEDKILTRWHEYCEGLLNEEFPRRYFPDAAPNDVDVPDITEKEVRDAVKRSRNGRAYGPDEIPSEFWKKMGTVGVKWLTVFISKLMRGDPMPDQWRGSFLIPLFKGKGDTRDCNNYRSIKLMSHTMKIVERVLDSRIRQLVTLSQDQCGFVGGKSTTDAIQSLRILMEKHRDASRDLHAVFVDFEKAFDRVPRDLIWVALRAKKIPETYVRMVFDMYERVSTKVRCPFGVSEDFPIKVGVHQGSVLSPLLFILVLDFLLEGKVMDPKVLQLFFADDGAIVSEDPEALQRAFDVWVDVLEGNGFRMSPKKTEYLHCPFSDPSRSTPDIYLNGVALPRCEKFKYLGSVINAEASCDSDINHRISVGWMKWRQNSAVFCDKRMPPKLKGKLYTSVVRPALTYGSQCWTMQKKYESKLSATEMKMLRMTAGVTKLDRIKSSKIRGSLHVKVPIVQKVKDDRLRWYCHVQRRNPMNPVQRSMAANVPRNGNPRRGRPRYTWMKQMESEQHQRGLRDEDIQNRPVCRYLLRSQSANPTRGAAANR